MSNTPHTIAPALRAEDRFTAAFDVHEGHALNGHNPSLHSLRRAALAHFKQVGFPAPKSEAWKYTNISKVLRRDYQIRPDAAPVVPPEAALAPFRIDGLEGATVVLVNGRFVPEYARLSSLPDGVVVHSFRDAAQQHAGVFNRHFAQYAAYDDAPMTALNTAFAQDGLFVMVPAGVAVTQPLHIINVISTEEERFLQPRHLIVVGDRAEITMIESQVALTDRPTFTNAVTECVVGAGGHATLYKIQDAGMQAAQVDTFHGYQGTESTLALHTTTLSGDVVRNNLNLLPDAEHCETNMYGLFLADGAMHVDNHTLVDHAQPNCVSNELYKGILDDRATGVFNGKVLVRRDAQKTNAYQSNKAVLLTDTAHMYSKPELEIYADDVKCSHGATTGQVEPEALFYLRSRGLTVRQARAMLLLAFARDVLEHVRIEPLRTHLDARVADRL